MTQIVPAADVGGATVSRRPAWWLLLPAAGLVWWAGGHLFWLVDGLRGVPVGARTALPLVPSMLSGLVVGSLVGGVGAGLLARAATGRRAGLLATVCGTALAVVLALVVTTATLRTNAPDSFVTEPAVLLGLSALVVLVSLAAWGVGALSALGPAWCAPGLALLAGAASWWCSSVLLAVAGGDAAAGLGRVGVWVGAGLLTAALVVVGARPVALLAWWPGVVLLAWLVAPALTAAGYLEQLLRPGAGLPAALPDALSAAWQVFGQAASPAHRDVLPWVLAIAVAGALVVVRPRLRRR